MKLNKEKLTADSVIKYENFVGDKLEGEVQFIEGVGIDKNGKYVIWMYLGYVAFYYITKQTYTQLKEYMEGGDE